MPFSGKSEAVKIAKELDIPVVRMGDLVWEEVKRNGLELTSENVGKIAHKLRIKKGRDIWARKTIERIQEMHVSQCIVIDGVRNNEEIEAFKSVFGSNYLLISIDISDKIRHHRAMNRGRIDDSVNIDDIKSRDEREINWGIKEVIKKADKTFVNNGSLDSFRLLMKKFFTSI